MRLVGDRHDVIVRLGSVLTWDDLEEVPSRVVWAQRELVDFAEAHMDDSLQSDDRSTNKGGGVKMNFRSESSCSHCPAVASLLHHCPWAYDCHKYRVWVCISHHRSHSPPSVHRVGLSSRQKSNWCLIFESTSFTSLRLSSLFMSENDMRCTQSTLFNEIFHFSHLLFSFWKRNQTDKENWGNRFWFMD